MNDNFKAIQEKRANAILDLVDTEIAVIYQDLEHDQIPWKQVIKLQEIQCLRQLTEALQRNNGHNNSSNSSES